MSQGKPDNICGYEKDNGETCELAAGWGTDQDSGRCKYHNGEADERVNEIKKEFLNELENNVVSISRAAKNVGSSQASIWRYRQKDDEFDRRVEEAKDKQEEMRVEKVEDSMFRRVLSGDATGGEAIFWLKNRAPDRWSDDPEVEINNNMSQQQGQNQASMAKIGDALEALDEGLDEVRQEESQAQVQEEE